MACPTSTAGSFLELLRNVQAGVHDRGSADPAHPDTTQPGSQAPHPARGRGAHRGHLDTAGHPPARTLINSPTRQRVNPMETCQLSFLLGQAPLLAGTVTTLAKLFLWELGVSDLGVGSDLLLKLHFCASVYMWLPFF